VRGKKHLIRIKTNAYVNGKKTSVRKEPINVQTMQHLVTSANTSDANWKKPLYVSIYEDKNQWLKEQNA
jgi:hypothetical protein